MPRRPAPPPPALRAHRLDGAGPGLRLRRATLVALPAWLIAGCAGPPAVPPARPVPLPPGAATPVPGSAPGPARGGADAGFAWTRDAESAYTAFARYLGGGAQVRRSADDRVWVVLPGDTLWADGGRAALLPPAHRWLDQVALVMKAWPAAELRLVGHTDARGAAAANDALSLERAASARDWLVARGVAARRLSVAGRGSRDAGQPGGDRRLELLLGERAR